MCLSKEEWKQRPGVLCFHSPLIVIQQDLFVTISQLLGESSFRGGIALLSRVLFLLTRGSRLEENPAGLWICKRTVVPSLAPSETCVLGKLVQFQTVVLYSEEKLAGRGSYQGGFEEDDIS